MKARKNPKLKSENKKQNRRTLINFGTQFFPYRAYIQQTHNICYNKRIRVF